MAEALLETSGKEVDIPSLTRRASDLFAERGGKKNDKEAKDDVLRAIRLLSALGLLDYDPDREVLVYRGGEE